MAATQILAVAAGKLDSADIALPAGTLISLKGATQLATLSVYHKGDGATYTLMDKLDYKNQSKVLGGAGTFRFTRGDRGTCGAFYG